MAKICNINFLIGNDPPPPLRTFLKIHPFLKGKASLRGVCLWQNICNSGKSSQQFFMKLYHFFVGWDM